MHVTLLTKNGSGLYSSYLKIRFLTFHLDGIFRYDGYIMPSLPTPEQLQRHLPLSDTAHHTVLTGRHRFIHILKKQDPRFIVIVGPCSLHHPVSAITYAKQL